MSSSTEPPKPPYVLICGGSEGLPLALEVAGRSAVPLFDSPEKARTFLESAGFGEGFRPQEVSSEALILTLQSLEGLVESVAVNPPPAREGGMKVRLGGLTELVEALQESRDEVNLFDFLADEDGKNGSGDP